MEPNGALNFRIMFQNWWVEAFLAWPPRAKLEMNIASFPETGMAASCMPWMSCHGLPLHVSHLNRAYSQFTLKSQKHYDSMLLSRMCCLRNDDFDDSEFGEPSYIYATRFCRLAGSEDLLALANEDGRVIVQVSIIGSWLLYFPV